jgi:tight adherence protein B
VVICLGSIIFAAILLFVLSGGRLVGASMGALVGILIPRMIVNKKAANRAKAFNFQLCDALTLVANSLRTGYSFLQSIEMVAKEMPAPVSVEFSRVRREMNLGLTTEDAMNNLARRVDSADLDLVVTAVLIQRQVGGNLAEILDNIGSTVRERIKMKREVNALTAQGRMSGFIIGSLPIGLGVFIYFVNPKYMEILFSSPFGQMMLVGAFCGQVVGIILIRKIVNIDI